MDHQENQLRLNSWWPRLIGTAALLVFGDLLISLVAFGSTHDLFAMPDINLIFIQSACAEGGDSMEEIGRLYDQVEYRKYPIAPDRYGIYTAPQHKQCLEILEPKISGSLKENGDAQLIYGLLLVEFHRYKEAREHLKYGLKFFQDYGYSNHLGEAEETLANIPRLEGAYKADRAYGSGSVGLVLNHNDDHVGIVLPESPAARAGMIDRDRIVAIDSARVDPHHFAVLSEMLRGKVGSVVTITLQRKGKNYSCRLVRADIDAPFYLPSSLAASIATSGPGANKANLDGQINSSLSSIGDASMISIFRRTNETKAIYAEVLRGLGFLPASVKQELTREGIKIVITPTVLEALPDLATASPRGYRYYDSFNYAGALYEPSSKTVYVAERIPYRRDLSAPQLRITATLLHEIGHAFDSATDATKSETFLNAYKTDCQHIGNTERSKFDYFLQDGNEGGPREMFAELFAIATCPPSEVRSDTRGLDKTFPSCFIYVRDRMH